MSRIQTLRASTARTARMAVAIRAAANSNSRKMVNTIRIRPEGAVTAYDWRPAALDLSPEEQKAISELMRAVRPDIDWTVGHDFHLTTGMLRRSPVAGERGYAPEVEGTFGGSDPVFLPPTGGPARIEAA